MLENSRKQSYKRNQRMVPVIDKITGDIMVVVILSSTINNMEKMYDKV